MALNGGVSLAVWMGGCAVELDRARRADEPSGETPRVYDALCACFGRRLAIDILTGASAGGINGALLGAAMVHRRKLDATFVRRRWLNLGDLSKLLYPTAKEDPRALMDGEYFHRELLRTFEGVLGENKDADGFKECRPLANAPRQIIPSLDVTMTDVRGVEKSFRDAWHGELIAREHRPRFEFREAAHFSAPALASAARTSASFPIAFEPWRVDGDPQVLAKLDRATYGIDGGLLDNAPIEVALGLIPSRPANSRVLRYVCYLNGDPPLPGGEVPLNSPGLREVGGYVVNLPRTAPFVDQLYAIKRAVERSHHSRSVQLGLLTMDLGELRGVALALFDAYVERRTMQSLEELLEDPGEATATARLMESTSGRLPWIPFGLDPPSRERWHWGIRPAQRILHLLLDLIRPLVDEADGALRRSFLETRRTIDEMLTTLGEARESITMEESLNNPSRFTRDPPLDRLEKAAARAVEQAEGTYDAVETAATAVRGLVELLPDDFEGRPLMRSVFGDPGDDDWLPRFFARTLSIEVIRRAFSTEAEIESAEELRFVQLTPATPSPIFTSGPLRLSSPASAREKLAGIGLGHFAGFYRRSWRANDFMWGRLDAAGRIVDLLLDRPSDETGIGAELDDAAERAAARSSFLVDALLPAELPEKDPRLWLAAEAVADAEAAVGSTAVAEAELDVREAVREAIKAELLAASPEAGVDELPFTRAVFQRAAQLEIVAEELPVLRQESDRDHKQGSAAEPLVLGGAAGDAPGDVEAEVKAVRGLYEAGRTLPRELTDPAEEVSDLGLRTITHASFVGLSAIRGTGAPLSKFFGLVRTPLLGVAGAVAQSRLYRTTVVLGIWAAAIYLNNRLVTANCTPVGDCAHQPAFSDAWSWATLTALVAALGVLGVAAVPGLRAWRGVRPPRNALLAIGLIGTAAVFAAILAWTAGELDSLPLLLFPPGAETPPLLVLLAPLFAVGVLSAARLPLPGWLGKFGGQLERLRAGKLLALPLIGSFLLLGGWAGASLLSASGESAWHAAGAFFAIVCAPAAAIFTVALWEGRKSLPAVPEEPDQG
jgi:hypothetical protein